MKLAKQCQGILDVAEQRITKLRESFTQPAKYVEHEEAPVSEAD